MLRIFISYRREETVAYARSLYRDLGTHFPEGQIFWDISQIDPGVDFVDAIERAVGSCDALIAVIGREWLNVADHDGQRQLDNPADFVRLEIATVDDGVADTRAAGMRVCKSAAAMDSAQHHRSGRYGTR